MKRRIIALCLLFASASPQASPTPGDLPPTPIVRQSIDGDSEVAAARAALESARLEAGSLARDPYEWTVRGTGQMRRLRNGPDYGEWSLGVEKTLRLPGKAALDRELGAQIAHEAESRYGDARHQASRDLLKLWMDWLAAGHANALLAAQRAAAENNLKAVEKRFRAGDAARLDVNLARADLAEAQRAESASATRTAMAWSRFHERFPRIPQSLPALAEPPPLTDSLSRWQARILAHSHEILLADVQVRAARAEAARRRAERRPDPTLGAYLASEFGGQERILGASVSVPIPGVRRSLAAGRADALAQAAQYRLAARRRAVAADAAAAYAEAQGGRETWQAAERAATAMQRNAALLQRAYALGETDLQSLLLARRQAAAATLNAQEARLAALRAYYLLRVDAHEIWDMEREEHEER